MLGLKQTLSLAWCFGNGALSFLPSQRRPMAKTRNAANQVFNGVNIRTSILQSSSMNYTFSGPMEEAGSNGDFAEYMNEDYRYASMQSLLQWAVDSGIEFAPGTEIVADSDGDWSVELVESKEQGAIILTIPSDLILSTKFYDGSQLHRWMEQNILEDTYFLPECILAVGLLGELSKGQSSRWHTWLNSLPTSFSIGIFLDSFERSHVLRFAPSILEQHEKHWQICNSLISKLTRDTNNILPSVLQSWLRSQPNLSLTVQWAFSIVLTRSWRSPDGKHASLVPIGDMLNHNSQYANVRPCIRKFDSALQLCLVEDTLCSRDEPVSVHLTYGLSYQPARFLVNFGFCDTSAALIDAHVDRFLLRNGLPSISDEKTWPPIDPSDLVVSTINGAVSREVWVVFLLKVLLERDPSQIERVQNAYDADDDESLDCLLDELFDDWELSVALELKGHIEFLLDNVYPDLSFTQQDFATHPRLPIIARYNFFMRQVFQKVLSYLNLLVDQTTHVLARGTT